MKYSYFYGAHGRPLDYRTIKVHKFSINLLIAMLVVAFIFSVFYVLFLPTKTQSADPPVQQIPSIGLGNRSF